MKAHLIPFLAIPLVFSACGPGEPSSGPAAPTSHPGLPPGHKPYDGPHQATYQLGMGHGRADGSSGKSRQPSRHYGTFPATETAAFNRGYQAGYSLVTRPSSAPPASRDIAGPGLAAGPAGPAPAAIGPLSPFRSPGKVTLRRGGQIVSICHTAMPRVEVARFLDGQRQIVVKSRALDGPATLQLFDTSTGEEVARVMDYQVQGGFPSWAAGLGG